LPSTLKFVLEKKINVISSAEEMAYPKAQSPELAKELDRIARKLRFHIGNRHQSRADHGSAGDCHDRLL
jgi:hypothetical protein